MLRTIALGAAVALLLLSGAVAGLWSNRWGLSMSTAEARQRLEAVPLALDGWEVVREMTLSEGELRQGEIAGYFSRVYVNRRTGDVVSVLALCGRPGPLSVHMPEVCYGNTGWEQTGKTKVTLPGGPFEFDVLDMNKQSPTSPARLRLYLALGSKGTWSVPKRPRIAFAGQAALYKLYVSYEAAELPGAADQGPAVDLLKALMPRLQEGLFPAG
jgi:Protein of unknown function (DUF3485)